MSNIYFFSSQKNIEKIYTFISKKTLAVISTTSLIQMASQTALIAFTQNDQLEIFFMTFCDSRKYANLQHNTSVSLVIGFDFINVQYQGIAYELKDKASTEALKAFSYKETPCTTDFINDPRARFFKVIPKWIRYSDYTVCPADIIEIIK